MMKLLIHEDLYIKEDSKKFDDGNGFTMKTECKADYKTHQEEAAGSRTNSKELLKI